MDFSKLTRNNQIAVGGGAVALISGFLPWFAFGGGDFDLGFSRSFSGFESNLVVLGLLCVVAGVGVLAAKVLEVKDLAVQNLKAEQVAMVAVAVGMLFVMCRVLFTPGGIGRSWGMFVGFAAVAAALAGTFLSAKDVGIGIPTVDDFKSQPAVDLTDTPQAAQTPQTPTAPVAAMGTTPPPPAPPVAHPQTQAPQTQAHQPPVHQAPVHQAPAPQNPAQQNPAQQPAAHQPPAPQNPAPPAPVVGYQAPPTHNPQPPSGPTVF